MDFDSEEDYDLDEDFSESDDLTLGSDAIWLFPGGFQNQASNSVHAPSSEGIKPLDATAKLVMAYSQDLAGESHAPNDLVFISSNQSPAPWGRKRS